MPRKPPKTSAGEGQDRRADKAIPPSPTPADTDALCGLIRAHHRRRNFAMDQRKSADLAIMAFLRTQLGWNKDLGKTLEGKAIAEHAHALLDTAERLLADEATQKRQRIKPVITPEYEEWRDVIEAAVLARRPWDQIEAVATKEMEALGAQLPAWDAWAKDIRGLSPRGLSVIVGEAGNLSIYATHSKLWKRMGLAVMGRGDGLNDHRQGAPGPGATNADWIAEGYSAKRRSKIFVIGDVLIKTQGPYREVYLARKAYEVARAQELGLEVAPSAKIPAKRKHEFRSEGHIHRRAQRYMEKRLLRDLWRAWRAEGQFQIASTAKLRVPPPADNHEPLTAMVHAPHMAKLGLPEAARELSL